MLYVCFLIISYLIVFYINLCIYIKQLSICAGKEKIDACNLLSKQKKYLITVCNQNQIKQLIKKIIIIY